MIDYEQSDGDEYDPETILATDLPPKLEEFLPKEFYPDILLVYDTDNCAFGDIPKRSKTYWSPPPKQHRTNTSEPHGYKRVFPAPESDCSSDKARIASLHLCTANLHALGHHSSIYRAPFTPPEPLTTNSRSRNGQVTVIAKIAFAALIIRLLV